VPQETIKETFDLSSVPRQAYYIGLAGVLPYLATSLSTVGCAYEINHAVAGSGYVISAQTAEALLHILEPLQIGYGAVVRIHESRALTVLLMDGRYCHSSEQYIGGSNGPVTEAITAILDMPLE
jgi:hypothetical protein